MLVVALDRAAVDVRVSTVFAATQIDEEVIQHKARTAIEIIVPVGAARVVAIVEKPEFERPAREQAFAQYRVVRRHERKWVERCL